MSQVADLQRPRMSCKAMPSGAKGRLSLKLKGSECARYRHKCRECRELEHFQEGALDAEGPLAFA